MRCEPQQYKATIKIHNIQKVTMGKTKNVDMSATEDTIKRVEAPAEAEASQPEVQADQAETTTDSVANQTETAAKATETDKTEAETAPAAPAKKRQPKTRSPKYQKVRSQVDKTRTYDAFSAVELVKRLSYSKFPGTISAHGVVKDTGLKVEVKFPHATGQTRTVAIASDELLKQIEAGQIEFDVLLSTPDMMPKLAKHARVLGPKGLMPNPKNGTIVDNPEKAKKAFESGKTLIATERKAPLIHVAIGKTDLDTKQIVENLQTLTTALRGKLFKLTISATMSPGVKVEVG